MKTIATAAVLMMLSAPVWADEAEKQTNQSANSNEPIVLSEAEMDGVTAGMGRAIVREPAVFLFDEPLSNNGWTGTGWDLSVGEVTLD